MRMSNGTKEGDGGGGRGVEEKGGGMIWLHAAGGMPDRKFSLFACLLCLLPDSLATVKE